MIGVRTYKLFLATFLIQGCISVGGNEDKSISFGVISVKEIEGQNSRTEKQNLFGIWVSRKNAGLGYKEDQKVILNSDCQIIFVTKTADEFEAAINLLNSTLELNEGQICTVETEK